MSPQPWRPIARRLIRGQFWILLIAFLPAVQDIPAETNIPVSAAQILSDALAHSLDLKISDQDIAAARARALQAQSQFLPSLNLDARAGHYAGLQDAVFGPGIVIPTVDNQYGAAATLSQPLFTGGRIVNQSQSAGYQTDAATHSRRSLEAGLRLQALTTYWAWSKTFYALKTLLAAVARMEAHAADMHNLYQAGLATDNDALSTDVLLDQTRLRLETVQRRDQLARAQIAFLIGYTLPSNAAPEFAAAAGADVLAPEGEALNTAKTNRIEYTVRKMELNAAQAQISANRANYFPHFYATARYEQARPNMLDFPPQDQWNYDAYIGVSLTWNILDWGLTRGKVSEAMARAMQARWRLTQQDERIILEVRQARIDMLDAINRLTVAKRAEKSAQRNLESATDLWHNGLLRHSELLDAHAKLTDAQYDTLTTQTDVVLAQTTLDYALGQLKGEP